MGGIRGSESPQLLSPVAVARTNRTAALENNSTTQWRPLALHLPEGDISTSVTTATPRDGCHTAASILCAPPPPHPASQLVGSAVLSRNLRASPPRSRPPRRLGLQKTPTCGGQLRLGTDRLISIASRPHSPQRATFQVRHAIASATRHDRKGLGSYHNLFTTCGEWRCLSTTRRLRSRVQDRHRDRSF